MSKKETNFKENEKDTLNFFEEYDVLEREDYIYKNGGIDKDGMLDKGYFLNKDSVWCSSKSEEADSGNGKSKHDDQFKDSDKKESDNGKNEHNSEHSKDSDKKESDDDKNEHNSEHSKDSDKKESDDDKNEHNSEHSKDSDKKESDDDKNEHNSDNSKDSENESHQGDLDKKETDDDNSGRDGDKNLDGDESQDDSGEDEDDLGSDGSNTSGENSHTDSESGNIYFIKDDAGYSNVIGIYQKDSDGEMLNPNIIIDDQHPLTEGQLVANVESNNYDFFIVANGANQVKDDSQISFDFSGSTPKLLIDGDESTTPVYFTDPALNEDGKNHFIFEEGGNGGTIIKVEDLPNLGDSDFDDVVLFADFEIKHSYTEVPPVDEPPVGEPPVVVPPVDESPVDEPPVDTTDIKITDLTPGEEGLSINFKMTADHYDPENGDDTAPEFKIYIDGKLFESANGNDTFSVESNRDRVVDNKIVRDVNEIEFFTLKVPEGTNPNSISIEYINDVSDGGPEDRDQDGILCEDRNLVVLEMNVGGSISDSGVFIDGTSYDSKDVEQAQYLRNGEEDKSGRDTMAWNGTMTFHLDGIIPDLKDMTLYQESFENLVTENSWSVIKGEFTGDHGMEWKTGESGVEIQNGNVGGLDGSDGTSHAELDADGYKSLVDIESNITLNHDDVTISFDYAPRPNAMEDSPMEFNLIDSNGDVIINKTVNYPNQIDFETYSFNLPVPKGDYTIEFKGLGDDDNLGAFIDSIQVVESYKDADNYMVSASEGNQAEHFVITNSDDSNEVHITGFDVEKDSLDLSEVFDLILEDESSSVDYLVESTIEDTNCNGKDDATFINVKDSNDNIVHTIVLEDTLIDSIDDVNIDYQHG